MSFVGGVGQINCDLLFSGLDRLPQLGEEIYAQDFALHMGGGVPAIMIELSRLGVPARLCTALGKGDLFSRFAQEELDRSGVQYQNFYEGDALPVTVTAVAITPGERTFLSSRADKIACSDYESRIYRAFHGAKVVRMNATPALADVFRQLKREGTILVYDTGWSATMSLKKYAPQLELADYYLPNRAEALRLTGCTDVCEAANRIGEYMENVVVKLDANGCLLQDARGRRFLGVLPETNAVDSTGAGDAFCAGFIYGLFGDYSLDDCVRLGSVMGGLCVRAVGCLERYVARDELLALYPTVKEIANPCV